MHFFPNAVIQGRDFDISDLVSEKARLRIRRLRPSHRRSWLVLATHRRGWRLLTFTGATMAKLLSRPSAAPAAAADRIRSRRDVESIFSPLRNSPLSNYLTATVQVEIAPKSAFCVTVDHILLPRRHPHHAFTGRC